MQPAHERAAAGRLRKVSGAYEWLDGQRVRATSLHTRARAQRKETDIEAHWKPIEGKRGTARWLAHDADSNGSPKKEPTRSALCMPPNPPQVLSAVIAAQNRKLY